MPETITMFGRYFPLYQQLTEILRDFDLNSVNAFIVGAGNTGSTISIGSFEPYELANAIEKAGISDYLIDIMDISDEVLDHFRLPKKFFFDKLLMKQPSKYMRLDVAFWQQRYQDVNGDSDGFCAYLREFFPERQTLELDSVVIRVDESLVNHFNPLLGDLNGGTISQEHYHIVVCNATLEYTQDPSHSLLKICNAVTTNGLLIIDSPLLPNTGWELLAQTTDGDHPVGLYQRT